MTSKQHGPHEPASEGSPGQHGTARPENGPPERETHGGDGRSRREAHGEDGQSQREAHGASASPPDDNGAMNSAMGDGGRGGPDADGGFGEPDLGEAGSDGTGLGGTGLGGAGFGGGGSGGGGEDELRNLLQSAVQDLAPSPDSLETLRRAVPARRRRRRHAVVGAAAVLLLGGTAMPAMLHVANGGDDAIDRRANAASSSEAHVTTGGTKGGTSRRHSDRPAGKDGKKTDKDGKRTGKDEGKAKDGRAEEPGGPAADPTATMDVTSPTCLRAQLGSGSGSLGTPDAEGRVYGALRIVNTSTATCSVDGGGSVIAVAQGSADPTRVQVVDHTAGDAAPGLPDPAVAPDQIVLKPGQAYEVKFAWIPAEGGGPSGCAAPGTPTPGSSEGAGSGEPANPSSADGSGDQAGGGSEGPADGGTQTASVAVSHTPEAGEPSAAATTINDACAGTVYRTGPLPGQ
ncbi:DUF4232 domain-containing protein [Streptomyces sp. NPDC000151]|uniref:DUF4232 domain-containing protein n=1 Tax=Streptomyces sp. NPDC000151 TaxID=3154244 RepID=UPI00332B0529